MTTNRRGNGKPGEQPADTPVGFFTGVTEFDCPACGRKDIRQHLPDRTPIPSIVHLRCPACLMEFDAELFFVRGEGPPPEEPT